MLPTEDLLCLFTYNKTATKTAIIYDDIGRPLMIRVEDSSL